MPWLAGEPEQQASERDALLGHFGKGSTVSRKTHVPRSLGAVRGGVTHHGAKRRETDRRERPPERKNGLSVQADGIHGSTSAKDGDK